MTCKKCGKEVFSGDLFCENCGEKVSTETTEAKQPSAFENFMNKFKSDKKTRNIGLAVLGGLIVIIIAIAIIASAGNTIKLTDYITAEVIGIDGYGTVQFDIDEEKLYGDVFGAAPADTYENLAKLLQYEEKCDNLMDCITILVTSSTGFVFSLFSKIFSGNGIRLAADAFTWVSPPRIRARANLERLLFFFI